MNRHALKDRQWAKIARILPKNSGRPAKLGDRNFIDAVLYVAKTGVPWRDVPDQFGSWKTIYNRFRRWAVAGIWQNIFSALAIREEKVVSIFDSSTVRVHQDGSGGRGGPKKTRSAGRSRASRVRSIPS
ncbi:MAG: IS5 family transposase [Cytophagaceae bacterium]|nr:MAG: IS5 family transposase [Cytophagaceae bacterium]